MKGVICYKINGREVCISLLRKPLWPWEILPDPWEIQDLRLTEEVKEDIQALARIFELAESLNHVQGQRMKEAVRAASDGLSLPAGVSLKF